MISCPKLQPIPLGRASLRTLERMTTTRYGVLLPLRLLKRWGWLNLLHPLCATRVQFVGNPNNYTVVRTWATSTYNNSAGALKKYAWINNAACSTGYQTYCEIPKSFYSCPSSPPPAPPPSPYSFGLCKWMGDGWYQSHANRVLLTHCSDFVPRPASPQASPPMMPRTTAPRTAAPATFTTAQQRPTPPRG